MVFQLNKDTVLYDSNGILEASQTGMLTAKPHPMFKNGIPSVVKQMGPYSSDRFVYDTFSGTDIAAVINVPNEKGPLVLGEMQTISYSIHRENTPVRTLGHVNVRGFVRGSRTIAGSLIFTQFNQYTFYRLEQYRQQIGMGLYPLADMIPAFDIILTFQNESGAFSKMKIFGVTIVDEGTTMSVDDLYVEQTYTWMARGIQPLTAFMPDTFELLNRPDGTRVPQPHIEFR